MVDDGDEQDNIRATLVPLSVRCGRGNASRSAPAGRWALVYEGRIEVRERLYKFTGTSQKLSVGVRVMDIH